MISGDIRHAERETYPGVIGITTCAFDLIVVASVATIEAQVVAICDGCGEEEGCDGEDADTHVGFV